MGKPRRVEVVGELDVPVPEASAVVAVSRGGTTWVLAVGDRTAELAVGAYDPARPPGEGMLRWETVDLSGLGDWPLAAGEDSQVEGIAADGGSLVVLLREDPPVAIVVDTQARRVVSVIDLVVPPWSAIAGRWDDPSSRGEGVVLLRGGRLLVAKEKRPRALVEFGPPGTQARGVSQDDLLGPDEAWDPPLGHVTYHALATWRLKGDAKSLLADISGVSPASDGLWLVSDASSSVARLGLGAGLPRGGGTIRTLDEVYRLPKGAGKAEGMAALEPGRALVVLDSHRPSRTGLVVEWARGRQEGPDG